MLTGYFYKVRQKCWEIIDRDYPEKKDKYSIVRELITISMKEKDVILDAGCGHETNIPDCNGVKVKKIGIDMVLEDVRNNKAIDFGLVSNINSIPLKNESVDIIMCNMVFEHLKEPEKTFEELSRILKKNGHLVFMTPCIYNIVTFANSIIPNQFHRKIGNLLTGADESDIFPTFYKANSIGKLRRMLYKNNFVEKDLIMYQPPPYAFVFSTTICKLMIQYYHLINRYDWLKFLRGVIIARYQKV